MERGTALAPFSERSATAHCTPPWRRGQPGHRRGFSHFNRPKWNPLTYVTDEDKAAKFTQRFAVASRAPGSRPEAYFDPKAEDLLASMFLAAALD